MSVRQQQKVNKKYNNPAKYRAVQVQRKSLNSEVGPSS